MLLEVRIPSNTRWWRKQRGKYGKRYSTESYQTEIQFVTMAYRLALPKQQSSIEPFVWADVWIPEDRRAGIPILDQNWIAPGVYRTRVSIRRNSKTLASFLLSGMSEMDVGEAA
ncbi:hypothetical protein [Caballeronia sp. GaOx3]|uniref:hypothetical protein n=1 Tax=Caballeronia sp. GaOx3 TaxID=2921740 RepID=UPI002027C47F|nr:hypothetical protein [Caballeronia sp. GaOx3]